MQGHCKAWTWPPSAPTARPHRQAGRKWCAATRTTPCPRFWGDADGSRYRAPISSGFPNVWAQGDLLRSAVGRLRIHGRSIPRSTRRRAHRHSAIYRQVETIPELLERGVGQDWQGDQRVVLFVRLRGGGADHDLQATIGAASGGRDAAAFPARIIAVRRSPHPFGQDSEVASAIPSTAARSAMTRRCQPRMPRRLPRPRQLRSRVSPILCPCSGPGFPKAQCFGRRSAPA